MAAAYADTGALMASLDQVPEHMDNPNDVHNVEIQISQILTAYPLPPVQKAGQDLLDEIHLEHKAREEAVAAGIQVLLKRVAEEVGTAKKAADLDGIIADLQKFLDDRYGFNSENQAHYQEVSAGFDFAKLWQNYLSHSASGQTQLAVSDLQNINQNNYALGILPRSQILDRLTAVAAASTSTTPEAVTILKNIKTLDEMEPALKQLSQLPQNDPATSRAYNNLAPMVQLYTSIKTGLPQTINFNFVSNPNETGVSPALQIQLLVFVLQHYFDSYKGAAPAADEKPGAFVDRVIADAISREDWPLLRKAINGQAYLNRNSALAMSATSNLSNGLDDLLSGVNQEAASQYGMAVASYQNALRVSDTTIPAKWIGDRLAAIKKDHPKEYEEGMEIVISSPSSKNFSGHTPVSTPPLTIPSPGK